MKLTDLLRRRSELAAQSASLAARAAQVSDELARVDSELFGRMKSLVVAIEGPEADRVEPPSGSDAAINPTALFAGNVRMRPVNARTSRLEPHIINVLADADRPMTRNEIFDALMQRGIQVGGKNPKSNLSAHLSNTDAFVRDAAGLWTLKQKEIA